MFFQMEPEEYDYKRLRRDLQNEYMIQGIAFSGDYGIFQMMDASNASNKKLLQMAKAEGFNLDKYRKR